MVTTLGSFMLQSLFSGIENKPAGAHLVSKKGPLPSTHEWLIYVPKMSRLDVSYARSDSYSTIELPEAEP